MDVVEIIEPLKVGGYTLQPGDRVLATKTKTGWRLCFNGQEQDAPPGSVGAVGSPEVIAAAEKRSAREEEYQAAPPT